jgi:clan AA aspartic protease (TIGR02281 family)
MFKHAVRLLLIVIFVVASGAVWSDGMIYKCKNQQGNLIYQKTRCMTKDNTVTAWTPVAQKKPESVDAEQDKNAVKKDAAVLKLKQNSNGHYATDASINEKPLNFVVDTGATLVSLPESIAHGALIYCDNKVDMNTANGLASACSTKIKKLQFGPFVVSDVEAVIMPNLAQPLLGMNVLQLFKVAQEKGEMHISYQPSSNQVVK